MRIENSTEKIITYSGADQLLVKFCDPVTEINAPVATEVEVLGCCKYNRKGRQLNE